VIFQPLSGPGWRIHKRGATVEQIRTEIRRRLEALPGGAKIALPAIIPADRGYNTANWQVESWTGLRDNVRDVILAVMTEFEVEEPGG
jgi:hypothetical protein